MNERQAKKRGKKSLNNGCKHGKKRKKRLEVFRIY